MKKIKSISINGKPLTMCKLGGGILMDKRKPTAYLFPGGIYSIARFSPIALEVDESFEIDYELLSPTKSTVNSGDVITKPENGMSVISVKATDLSTITPYWFTTTLSTIQGARHVFGVKKVGVKDEQFDSTRMMIDGQLVGALYNFWKAVVQQICGNTYGAHCIVHGVRINGGEWISLDELPGIRFSGNITKVK